MPSNMQKKAAKVESTPFSDFFRSASPSEKQRVYSRVIEASTAEQNRIISEAEARHG